MPLKIKRHTLFNGVMAAQQILVLFVQVRVLVEQLILWKILLEDFLMPGILLTSSIFPVQVSCITMHQIAAYYNEIKPLNIVSHFYFLLLKINM